MSSAPAWRFDTHAHVWGSGDGRYPYTPIPPAKGSPESPCPAGSLLDAMQQAEIATCVLVQPSTYGWNNDYLLDVVAGHPDRFVAVVLVDPSDTGSPRKLTELAATANVRGVRFHVLDRQQAGDFTANGAALCAAAFDAGLVVAVQVNAEHLALIDDMLRRCDTAGTVVIDHMGLVDPADSLGTSRLLSLATHPNVFVKLSGAEVLSKQGYPFADCRPLAEAIVERFGTQRVMWASNYPHVLKRCTMVDIAEIAAHLLPGLTAPERSQVEHETARSVWTPTTAATRAAQPTLRTIRGEGRSA